MCGNPAQSLTGHTLAQEPVYGMQGHSDKPSPISPHPVGLAHPTHSLIELRGPVQCLTDIRWQVPRVLCSIPGELFALGVVHISNVVECSRLPNLWAAVRYRGSTVPQGTHPKAHLQELHSSPLAC